MNRSATYQLKQSGLQEMSRACELAATLYLHQPGPGMRLPQTLVLGLAGTDYECLRQDYQELFCRPNSGRCLTPYESLHRDGRMGGPHSQAVARLYAGAGFTADRLPADDLWRRMLLPDHIGYELAFAASLMDSLAQPWAMRASQANIRRTLETFWASHLSQWANAYGRKLSQTARTPLYRFLGQITEALAL